MFIMPFEQYQKKQKGKNEKNFKWNKTIPNIVVVNCIPFKRMTQFFYTHPHTYIHLFSYI